MVQRCCPIEGRIGLLCLNKTCSPIWIGEASEGLPLAKLDRVYRKGKSILDITLEEVPIGRDKDSTPINEIDILIEEGLINKLVKPKKAILKKYTPIKKISKVTIIDSIDRATLLLKLPLNRVINNYYKKYNINKKVLTRP